MQSPNLPAIIAALTSALQEAMARIEALEARRMSTVQRTVYINTIEPVALSMRVPSGMESRLQVTFRDPGGHLVTNDVLPQLEITGRTNGKVPMAFAMPAVDVANGIARAVIPAGVLVDQNGYRLNLYGTWNSEPILLATGVVDIFQAPGVQTILPDVIDRIDITLTHGSDTALNIVLWVDEGKTQPFDLSTVTVGAAVYASQGGPVLVPFTIASISGNAVMLSLTAAQVDALPDSCWWSLTVSDANGVTTLVEGSVTVIGP